MEFAFIANRIIELTLETFTVGVGFILGIALFFASIIAFQLFLESCFKVKNFLNKKLKADVKCGGVCRTEARMDKTCSNNKKTTCSKCGHVVVNGYCKECFFKDIEKADEMLSKAQKARIKFEAGYQIKRQKAITILIIIITISFIIGFIVGWLICFLCF